MAASGNIYSVPFSVAATTSGAVDLIGILAPANSQVQLRELVLGAVSSGLTLTSGLQVDFFRGSTASSTSAAITPVNLKPQSGALSAGSSVTSPCATLVSTSSATLVRSQGWNFGYKNFHYCPEETRNCVQADVNQRLHIRVSTPPAAMTIAGTAVFSEIGRITNE
jgi:hypothetical protein